MLADLEPIYKGLHAFRRLHTFELKGGGYICPKSHQAKTYTFGEIQMLKPPNIGVPPCKLQRCLPSVCSDQQLAILCKTYLVHQLHFSTLYNAESVVVLKKRSFQACELVIYTSSLQACLKRILSNMLPLVPIKVNWLNFNQEK